MGTILRLELQEHPTTPLRVRVQREDDGLDYGWLRLDELPHLLAVMAFPDEAGSEAGGP